MHAVSLMIKPASSSCNMRCTYCFYADETCNRSVANYGIMSMDTLEKVVRKAFAVADASVSFAFQGGEPTLAGASFFETLLMLQKKYNARHLPVYNALQTNGLHLTPAMLTVLKQGNFLVGVSVDGLISIHDKRRLDNKEQPTYQRIMDNVARMKAQDIPYNVLCVVDDAIASQATACYNNLKKHQYVQFIACMDGLNDGESYLSPSLYGEFLVATFRQYEADFWAGQYVSVRDFDNYIQRLQGRPTEICTMQGRCSVNFLVESNGDVYPCDFYALDEWRMGNIHQSNFSRMYKTEVAKRFVETSLFVPEACKQCQWGFLCRNGCRRYRNPQGHNKLCESYRYFFTHCYDGMQKMANQLKKGGGLA